MCLNVLLSILWYPLRFPRKNDDRTSFTSSCLLEGFKSYLRYLCLFAHSVFFFVLLPVFFWIVHFLLPRRYSITFIYVYRPTLFSKIFIDIRYDTDGKVWYVNMATTGTLNWNCLFCQRNKCQRNETEEAVPAVSFISSCLEVYW